MRHFSYTGFYRFNSLTDYQIALWKNKPDISYL